MSLVTPVFTLLVSNSCSQKGPLQTKRISLRDYWFNNNASLHVLVSYCPSPSWIAWPKWSQQNYTIYTKERLNAKTTKPDIPWLQLWILIIKDMNRICDKGQIWLSATPTERRFDLPTMQTIVVIQEPDSQISQRAWYTPPYSWRPPQWTRLNSFSKFT